MATRVAEKIAVVLLAVSIPTAVVKLVMEIWVIEGSGGLCVTLQEFFKGSESG